MSTRLLIALMIAASAIAVRGQSADSRQFTAKEIAQGWADGCVLAKPRPDRLAAADAEEAREGWAVERKFGRFGGLRVISLKPGDTSESAIARLRATGRYEIVDHDYIKHAYATAGGPPNDPDFSSQWGLSNTGSNPNIAGPGVAGADIHAVSAWMNTRTDAAPGVGPRVIVATLDTGIRLTHQDLAANLWTNPGATSGTSSGTYETIQYSFQYLNAVHGINATARSGSAASGNPSDDNGHGTHVAGIIGAVGNNGVDGSGVAWSVQLMPLKFLNSSGQGSTSGEIICLDFALANGAQILNGSFGAPMYDPIEYTALQTLDAAGIIFVFAAGNQADDNSLTFSYPASYALNNVVTVAASDNRDDVIFFSSYGSGNVDLAAPGYQILSTYNSSDTATAILSGTSMATPFVTGSLALLRAQFPGDSPRQLINRLLRHVDPNFNFNGRVQTGGRLNLAAALASAPGDNTPFNDAFASRSRLTGSSVSVRSSNVGASRESGEPLIGGNGGGASLWWEWTAPASGSVTLATAGSAYQTLVGVYTGPSLGSLVPVAFNTSAGAGTSSVTFTAQAGTTYELTVDGQNGATGLTVFQLAYNNDAFALPTTLSGPSAAITSTNRYATEEIGEPLILPYGGGHSVWYAWTAPRTGQFQVAVFSYDFDPLLGIDTGSSLNALTPLPGAQAVGGPIIASDNIPASICLCTIQATAGNTYRITVDGTMDYTTGLSSGQFTLTIADSLWQAVTQDSITCAPAVEPDGTVVVGSGDGMLYAFNPDGSTRWTYYAGNPFDTTAAAIAGDGTVYASSSYGGPLYSFYAAGGLKWSASLPAGAIANGAAALGSVSAADDTLYVKAQDGKLYAVNAANGSVKWTFPVPGVSYAPPSVGADGTVYIGADNSVLYAVSPGGAQKWTFTADAAIYTAPAIDGSGNLYFGTLGGTFYSLSKSGALRWSFAAKNSISSSAALGTNGLVFFGSYDHHLYALNVATGALQWSYMLGSEVRASSPAVDSNGVVYVGCYDGNLYAINPDGSLNRTFPTGGWVRSSPVIFGTNLYFGSYDHKLYAYNIGASVSGSPWPMLLAGAQRQGRATVSSPSILTQPSSQTIASGATVVLSALADGVPAPKYQWSLNGAAISGATNAQLVISNATAANAGSYACVASNSGGSATSAAASLSVISTSDPGRLINLSVNTAITAGNELLTLGFVTGGAGTTGSQNLLIRASGPALAPYLPAGVTPMPDPELTVLNPADVPIYFNAGWAGTPANEAAVTAADAATEAFALTNPASKDSATVVSLPSGGPGYTVQVGSVSSSAGTTLAELYDYTPAGTYTATTPRLVNMSSKFQVVTKGILTVGFTIGGSTSKTVLIRASGPALAPYVGPGVALMPDPQLSVFNVADSVIAFNAGWGGNPQVSAVAQAIGAFAYTNPSSADSAVLLTLTPGPYTAQASSASGTAGTTLVEVYEVP